MSASSRGSLRAGSIVLSKPQPILETQTQPVMQKTGGKLALTVYEQKFVVLAPDEVIQAGDVYPVLISGNFIQALEVSATDKVIRKTIATLPPGLWLRPVE